MKILKLLPHFILLMAFWLIMSGMFDIFHISLGLISVIIVLLINHQLLTHNYFHESPDAGKNFSYIRLPIYGFQLLMDIILSGITIARLVLNPSMPIKTCVSRFLTTLPTNNARVLLANSITLTPGTVTVQIDENHRFTVYSLTPASDPVWMNHGLAKKIAKLYRLDPAAVIQEEEIITSKEKL